MKAFIQHESRGRLRVRMHQYRMSLEQADLLEAYLLDQPGVKSAAVHERTCCATVCYTGSRAELLHAIGRFDYRSPGRYRARAAAQRPRTQPRISGKSS